MRRESYWAEAVTRDTREAEERTGPSRGGFSALSTGEEMDVVDTLEERTEERELLRLSKPRKKEGRRSTFLPPRMPCCLSTCTAPSAAG